MAVGAITRRELQMTETVAAARNANRSFRMRAGLLGLAAAAITSCLAPQPASAADPDLQWHYSRHLAADPFETRLILIYGVPETDLAQAVAQCRIGNRGPYATLDLGTEVGSLAANATVDVQFVGRGFDQIVTGSVIRAQEEGIDGVSLALQLDDPLWQAIRTQSVLHYNVTGFTATRLPLDGSNTPATRFVQDCREMPEPEAHAPTPVATAQPDDPRWATCEIYANERSRNSDVPVTVTFRNRSGAMRGVMWIDFNGRPVEYANLNAGETFSIQTYMTHPWMFTDGPGNCIEMFMPQPGISTFEISAPNRNFGPE